MKHIPVMLDETLACLDVKPTGVYVDATFGYGGHSKAILQQLTTGKLFVFDADLCAIQTADALAKGYPNVLFPIHDNYANIASRLAEHGVTGVDGILIDCGVSSMQLDEAERGFSYRYDAPLDMRMDQTKPLDAATIVNTYSYDQLIDILFRYGEERFAKNIARNIITQRKIKPIKTTFELVDIIKKSYPAKVLSQPGHPAKQTFQAIRIAVNDELRSLQSILQDGLDLLNPSGVMAVITFHSLEDRLVKQAFNDRAKAPKTNKRIPFSPVTLKYRLLNSKPILPTPQELKTNPRSASAKLRAIERK